MLQKSLALFFAGLLIVGISGCEKEEGPIEKAGKSLDQATDSVKESYEDAKDAVLDKGPAEKAGESVDTAVKSITE